MNDLFSLEGKNALVIGGSKGIGKGMATGLAKAGATVVLSSRNQADLNASAKEISELTKSKVIGIATDITSVDAVNNLVNDVISQIGHIDILINSAGVNVRKGCLDFTESDWDTVQDVQLKYVFFTCQAVAKHMVENGIRGKIINVASVTSTLGAKNMISYVAAKGGVLQLTKALALELVSHGICVNAMAPGYTATEMTRPIFENKEKVAEIMSRIPAQRFGEISDFEGIAVYLASDCSSYLTGQLINIDGGKTSS